LTALPRLGLVIGKKNVKLAVQRNRIKRQIREFFRIHQSTFTGLDLVFIARKGLDKIDNHKIREHLTFLLTKISKQKSKTSNKSNTYQT